MFVSHEQFVRSSRVKVKRSTLLRNCVSKCLLFDVNDRRKIQTIISYYFKSATFQMSSNISFLRTNLRTVCTYVTCVLTYDKKTGIRKEEEEEEHAVCLKFVSLLRKHGASKTVAEKTREQPTSGQQLLFPEGALEFVCWANLILIFSTKSSRSD